MVEITSGPFAGLAGIIQEPPDARGRVTVLMDLLNRQVPVEVPVEFVGTVGPRINLNAQLSSTPSIGGQARENSEFPEHC